MATADRLSPVVRDPAPEKTNESSGETQNPNRWSQLIHRFRPHRWLAEAAAKRRSQSLSTISDASMNPKRKIPVVRHLQKVAEWIVERSSQLGRSPPPRPIPPSPHMQPRIYFRPQPLVQTMGRNLNQTDPRTRSLAQCACHGDRAAFGAATPTTAYTCYPFDENVADPKHHDPPEAVDQQMAPAHPSSAYDTHTGAPRVLVRYGHY